MEHDPVEVITVARVCLPNHMNRNADIYARPDAISSVNLGLKRNRQRKAAAIAKRQTKSLRLLHQTPGDPAQFAREGMNTGRIGDGMEPCLIRVDSALDQLTLNFRQIHRAHYG